ncbi:MAG: EAL domain-containing protein [Spirochaetia bacterium]|nr:EAL domain-containing protein [Spirochaetia bacterium]
MIEKNFSKDLRIEKIFNLLMEFGAGNLEAREIPSDNFDEVDGIIGALNMLGEELGATTITKNFFESILKTMVDVLVITDSDLKILDTNQGSKILLGYEENELIGNSIEILFPGEMFLFEHLSKAPVEKGYFAGVETVCLSKSRINIPVSISISNIQITDPQVQKFIFIIHDISAYKRKEYELRGANQRIKSILDALPDLMFEIDLDGYFYNYQAPRFGQIALTASDIINKNVTEVFPSHSAELIMSSIRMANKNGWHYGTTIELELQNGKIYLELSVNSMPVKYGEVPHFIVLSRDITSRKFTELLQSKVLLDETQRLGHLGSWDIDVMYHKLTWSEETFRIFEQDPVNFTPSYEEFLNLIHPDDREEINEAYNQLFKVYKSFETVHRLLLPDGRIKWVNEHASYLLDSSGKIFRFYGAIQDITEQRRIEDELDIAAVTFDSHGAIVITDAEVKIVRVNKVFQNITGYSSEEVIGKNPKIMQSGRHDKAFYADMWKKLISTGSWAGEIWDRKKNGQIYPKWLSITAVKNKKGQTIQYVGIFNDITIRKNAEDEIRNLAYYDTLTNLPNRRLFLDRFRLALSKSEQSKNYGAVMFLDMDRFKSLNDMKGHEYGDLLLIEVGRRITGCLGEMDVVARLGGDEFVILIENISLDLNNALQKTAMLAEKIRSSLTNPYLLKDYQFFSSSSIGVCMFYGNEKSTVDLIRSADMAMYRAKESGRNTLRFFDPLMQETIENHATLESNLRTAISNKELMLYYQIQVDNEFKPLGAEALIRWQVPTGGFIPPTQFIPVAEESTLILDIGQWVIDNSCKQLALWSKNEKLRHLTLSINVSARQFGLVNFVETIRSNIEKYNIDPSHLKLELTEHVLLNDVVNVVTKMNALKDLGVWLSIDDFGTGYSSLSYLKQLPIHQLKIDQSFVRDITTDPNDAMMVKTIISLADNFRLNVIAEGVETEEQMSFLFQNGCKTYQGYLFGRPVPVNDFETLVLRIENSIHI